MSEKLPVVPRWVELYNERTDVTDFLSLLDPEAERWIESGEIAHELESAAVCDFATGRSSRGNCWTRTTPPRRPPGQPGRTNQQAVTLTPHDTLIHRPCLFLSKRAEAPLTVICQVRWRGG
jgi:hypothetical protein